VIISDPFGDSSYEFVVSWKKPETGGMPIVQYRFELRKVKNRPHLDILVLLCTVYVHITLLRQSCARTLS